MTKFNSTPEMLKPSPKNFLATSLVKDTHFHMPRAIDASQKHCPKLNECFRRGANTIKVIKWQETFSFTLVWQMTPIWHQYDTVVSQEIGAHVSHSDATTSMIITGECHTTINLFKKCYNTQHLAHLCTDKNFAWPLWKAHFPCLQSLQIDEDPP